MAEPSSQYKQFVAAYPDVGAAHNALGAAVTHAGPLDARFVHLVKLGHAVVNDALHQPNTH